jgi:hypothetical protein
MKECLYCEDPKVLNAGQTCECRLHKLISVYQNRSESLHNTVQSWKLASINIPAGKLEEVMFNIEKEFPLV